MIKLGYLKLKNPYQLDDKNLKALTHVNLSFAKVVDTNGTVEFDPYDENKLLMFRKQNPQMVISLAIGGWGAGNFSEASRTLENRKNFCETTLNYIKKYDLDGIDLDWEYPCCGDSGISFSADDKVNFTLLMEDLRESLNNLSLTTRKNYILTFAAGAQEKLVDCVELEKLDKLTDFMNLMTYDMGGSFGVAGHHASLYQSDVCENKGGAYYVDLYVNNGYSKNKIVFGAAFYGRGATGVKQIGSSITGKEGLYFDYHDIVENLKRDDVEMIFDQKAKAAYCFVDDAFITFENGEAIRAKIDYVIDNQLAGIMFWEYATDNTGELIDIIVNYK